MFIKSLERLHQSAALIEVTRATKRQRKERERPPGLIDLIRALLARRSE